jgi:hypothetical protein
MKRVIIISRAEYHYGDQIKEDRATRKFNTHWTDENFKNCKEFRSKILNGQDHILDLRVDGRIILKLILKNQAVRIWAGFIWICVGGGTF